jgi:flagellar hook capping protein FlgD
MRIDQRWFFLLCVSAGTWLGGSAVSAPANPGQAAWASGSWLYRIPITAKPDSIQGSGALVDISLLLKLGPAQASVFAGANANGSDLLITKADGTTPLGHEVVSFNPGAQSGEVWFRPDSLSKSVNKFYLYYGNPLATIFPAAGAAWNSKYLAVYHFSENPGLGVLKDWGPRGNNANAAAAGSNWTSGDVTTGQVGQAWNFNGTTHYLQAFSISTPDTSYVISAWLKLPSHTTDFTFQSNPGYWHVSAQINEQHRQPHFNAANPWRDLRWGPEPIPDDNSYHWYTWVFDGQADTVLFYFDGQQQPGIPWSLDPSLKHFYTGFPINPLHNQGVGVVGPMYWNSMDIMTGPGDEFRLNERTHSSNWIRTEYRNQHDPQNFYVFGPQEPGGVVPVMLTGGKAVREKNSVRLSWRVASDGEGPAGFRVYRELSGAEREASSAWITGGPEYTWVDSDPPAHAFLYWLEAVDRIGNTSWLGPIAVAGAEGRVGLVASPNPFRDRTRLQVEVLAAGGLTLRVIDLSGREVRTLMNGPALPGSIEAVWDGRDNQGRHASPGQYLIVAAQTVGVQSRKILLLP